MAANSRQAAAVLGYGHQQGCAAAVQYGLAVGIKGELHEMAEGVITPTTIHASRASDANDGSGHKLMQKTAR
jgi:hypothetical protein